MKKFLTLILMAAAVLSASAVEKEASIAVIDKVKFQHVTGFGGFSPSPTWQYWLNNNDMDKLFGKGDDQLGLNILRLYMANSRNAWNAGVSNAKRAKQHGAFIFASPWSPPASWKSNNSDSNGGRLLESHYADWANFLNDYYKYMKGQGVEIDAVSIQNEPDWNASYQSCIWTGEEMANFLKNYGSIIQCKIIAPEAIHFTRSMHEPILNDAEACAQLDILGGHFYGWDGSSYPLATKKDKEVWMTEYLINERQQNEGIDINWVDDGFLFAKSVNDAMLANMSAWVHYSLKRYYGCLGDGTYGTVNGQITKRGYILSHYAKYVSGTTRVLHTLSDEAGQLSASAYITDDGNSVVMMVLNPSADTYNLNVVLPFNTLGGRSITTTENVNMAGADLAEDTETSTPALEIAAYSVNTFIFYKSSDKPGGETGIDGTEVFSDNFEYYGASCIPDGWRAYSDNETRYAGNYSLGPRIMAFSPEGVMRYGFYFRSSGSNKGYITYGEETDMRLHLTPATYTIKYTIEGWKGTPSITFNMRKNSGRGYVVTNTAATEYFIESTGSAVRIVNATDCEATFDITAEGDYIMKWEIDRSNGGYLEALVGNIALVRHDTESIFDITIDPTDAATIYDIYGRPALQPLAPGLYIKAGKKLYIK